MFNWKLFRKIQVKKELIVEDITQVRNLQERLTLIKPGNAFALSTRNGLMIFKYIELRSHPKKEGVN